MSSKINASTKNDPRFIELVAILGSEDKALEAFDRLQAVTTPATPAAAAPVKSKADKLVEKHGYGYAKGRVYATPTLAEAIVRVHRNGKPEIVQSSGVGRTKAVLVSKQESGDVSLQNLTKA